MWYIGNKPRIHIEEFTAAIAIPILVFLLYSTLWYSIVGRSHPAHSAMPWNSETGRTWSSQQPVHDKWRSCTASGSLRYLNPSWKGWMIYDCNSARYMMPHVRIYCLWVGRQSEPEEDIAKASLQVGKLLFVSQSLWMKDWYLLESNCGDYPKRGQHFVAQAYQQLLD